ncbi:YvcK family protein [Alkaliphilus sp. MSJ-5]|uniref:Putative gluconeogenesis factor n=1 Tax=Alkaliphilus flagellatus TaxID=2841507 RepID=A0ABS6FYJ4_9FIRM|nr:YvcK family protein [Alkaliphilus flagellatus]MBU5675019.1 YvcK family protein [Alkaliphilus flagellatus]
MKLIHWLKPGLKIKRWVLCGLIGVFLIAISISYYLFELNLLFNNWLRILLGIVGLIILFFSLRQGVISILDLVYHPPTLTGKNDGSKLDKKIYDKKILARGPKIVVIGGGTGLSVLLRGLKLFTSNITAIVTVADDGGGSGKLREDLGMLPPGDIRNCILALADMEPTMEQLLQYRFEEGNLKGQSFGNLLIASMNGISGNFEEAIKKISDVLAVTGKVLPVTLRNITLYAKLKNGTVVKGESNIPVKSLEENSPIEKVFIKPKEAETIKEAIDAIEDADIVLLGPGSLYTSVIPNLLVKNIKESLNKTKALKVYITNVMTQPGETTGYTVYSYVNALLNHWPDGSIDYVIANTGMINNIISQKYETEGAEVTKLTQEDRDKLNDMGIKLITEDLIDIKKDYVRHDAIKLSKIIINLVLQWKVANDRNRIIDYFYIRELIKKIY